MSEIEEEVKTIMETISGFWRRFKRFAQLHPWVGPVLIVIGILIMLL